MLVHCVYLRAGAGGVGAGGVGPGPEGVWLISDGPTEQTLSNFAYQDQN